MADIFSTNYLAAGSDIDIWKYGLYTYIVYVVDIVHGFWHIALSRNGKYFFYLYYYFT